MVTSALYHVLALSPRFCVNCAALPAPFRGSSDSECRSCGSIECEPSEWCEEILPSSLKVLGTTSESCEAVSCMHEPLYHPTFLAQGDISPTT